MDENKIRRLAGLPTLSQSLLEAKKKKKVEDEVPAVDAAVDAAPAEDEVEEFPAIVSKIAKKAEGKTGDELVALIKKVYDAGVKDGMAQAVEPAKDE